MKNITSVVLLSSLGLGISCSTMKPIPPTPVMKDSTTMADASIMSNPFYKKSSLQYQAPEFDKIKDTCKGVFTIEMNTGQMTDDVQIALKGRMPVYFYGRTGGMIPTPEAIVDQVKKIYGGEKQCL